MAKHSDEFLRLATDARQCITKVSPTEARKRDAEGAFCIEGGLKAYEADDET